MPAYEQLQFPEEGPRHGVWNHLYSGLDQARWEIEDTRMEGGFEQPRAVPIMGLPEQRFLERWGELAVQNISDLLLDPEALDEEVKQMREVADSPTAQPWLAFATDLAFAVDGIERAQKALRRYSHLRTSRALKKLTPRTRNFLREAVQTFLFGFDAACIAFCAAAVEQELRAVALDAGVYTEARMKRERPTGQSLLMSGRREGLVDCSFDVAKRILDRRNEVLHRGIDNAEGLAAEALEHLSAMGQLFEDIAVCAERKRAQRAPGS